MSSKNLTRGQLVIIKTTSTTGTFQIGKVASDSSKNKNKCGIKIDQLQIDKTKFTEIKQILIDDTETITEEKYNKLRAQLIKENAAKKSNTSSTISNKTNTINSKRADQKVIQFKTAKIFRLFIKQPIL